MNKKTNWNVKLFFLIALFLISIVGVSANYTKYCEDENESYYAQYNESYKCYGKTDRREIIFDNIWLFTKGFIGDYGLIFVFLLILIAFANWYGKKVHFWY